MHQGIQIDPESKYSPYAGPHRLRGIWNYGLPGINKNVKRGHGDKHYFIGLRRVRRAAVVKCFTILRA